MLSLAKEKKTMLSIFNNHFKLEQASILDIISWIWLSKLWLIWLSKLWLIKYYLFQFGQQKIFVKTEKCDNKSNEMKWLKSKIKDWGKTFKDLLQSSRLLGTVEPTNSRIDGWEGLETTIVCKIKEMENK